MTEANKNVAPEMISFNEADVSRASAKEVLRAGWMQMAIISAEKSVTKTGKLCIHARCAPIDEAGVVASRATAKLDLYIPVTNPRQPEAEVAKTKGCYFFARSLDPKFPKYAKKVSQGKYTNQDTGETVDKAGSRVIEEEVNREVVKRSVEWYNDPSSLVQETFYGCVEHETGDDGTIYPKVRFTRLEKPEEGLITENFTMRSTK